MRRAQQGSEAASLGFVRCVGCAAHDATYKTGIYHGYYRRMMKDWPQARPQRVRGGLRGHGPQYCGLIQLQASVNRTWTLQMR